MLDGNLGLSRFRPVAPWHSRSSAAQSKTAKAISMSRELVAHNKPVFDQLHPRIYGAAVGLIAWFALMAWVLFDRSSDVSLSLMFVTVLFAVAIALPWALSLVWRRFQMPYEEHLKPTSFHDWTDGD